MSKQFGDRLKELRKNKNITQAELAKILNTGKASISHYESNRRLPDANIIGILADYFNVSVDYILGKTDLKKVELNDITQDTNLEDELHSLIERIEDDPNLLFKGQPLTTDIKLQLKGAIKMIESIAKQKEK